MVDELEVSRVMANARVDLAGNISGQFSPEDWEKILSIARHRLQSATTGLDEAWVEVIRDFHREKYWGFIPNYKKPKMEREQQNLGVRFIWYSFRSFLITKVAVLWFGARYSADFDPIYKWLFFGAIGFMLCAYGSFLWKFRNRRDE
ncbi:MAG: hypothetical protein AB7G93_13880 [Bdellovibrionales bacterium]